MKILKGLLMIITAPVILVLTLFVWLCIGLIYISGLVLGLLNMMIALPGVVVLLTYFLQNGLILLVVAFLISPMGLPLAAIWLLDKVQSLKFAIQHEVYGWRDRMSDLTSCLYKIESETAIFSEVKEVKRTWSTTAGRFLFGKEVWPMTTARIMSLRVGKGRTESQAISNIVDYVANPKKTDDGRLVTGYACGSRTAGAEFLLAKRRYIIATGRVRGADDVIVYHARQSFRPSEITPEEVNQLGVDFARRFTKSNRTLVVYTHMDKPHIHDHIIWSSISLEYDQKFQNFWGNTKAVHQSNDTICIENGLPIVGNPKPCGKSHNKWLEDQAKPSRRELLRVTIDNTLSQSPTNFKGLLKLLQGSDYEVSKRGKLYRLKLLDWEEATRMDNLGERYGLGDLQAVLSGGKAHTLRKKVVTQTEPPEVNLLVDVQTKLQTGKEAGYAQWAKVFNLKQMTQTTNYLSEDDPLEYAVPKEKAAAATTYHNELSAQIKAAGGRAAEIAILRTHIVNYAKTREVYVACRKAGYSKKFREEHEEEILLRQVTKNASDEMGTKKLPKVKELQAEHVGLLEEEKETYAEYRRSREKMREPLTAKANVN